MKNRCVVIAAAPNPEISFIRQSIKTDDFVICADAGYEAAFKAGIEPVSYTHLIPFGMDRGRGAKSG